uniref:Uncharacterized protein n=1 Tax=Chlamydomonas leiostraca TaxID=1034604 RepID=A0A7S0N717_9CHLO|mmetsp:Transcript_1030/g.2852  ORF Transcript_1030/g.2852 Transcript_1030/m.2852 type:complete len:105 (+) Transcript_1030:408-722(+)
MPAESHGSNPLVSHKRKVIVCQANAFSSSRKKKKGMVLQAIPEPLHDTAAAAAMHAMQACLLYLTALPVRQALLRCSMQAAQHVPAAAWLCRHQDPVWCVRHHP